MLDAELMATLAAVARFYDQRPIGHVGPEGFRRTTLLGDLYAALPRLVEIGAVVPGQTKLIDTGCGDGRVNVWFSYLVRHSFGVEVEDWVLEERAATRAELLRVLLSAAYRPPPDNTRLFCGDALGPEVYDEIARRTGVSFADLDLFYTFLCLHQELGAAIAERARPGALLMVYGLDSIVPELGGLVRLHEPSLGASRIVLYRKPGV